MKSLLHSSARKIFKGFFIVTILLISASVTAQFDISSFIVHIDTIQDERKKTSTYLFVAEYFIMEKPDQTLIYSEIALERSLKLNDSSLISDSYKYLGISYANLSECEKSDSILKTGINYILTPDKKAKYLIDMGAAFGMCGKLDESYKYYNEAKEILKTLNDQNTLKSLLINLGVSYARSAQYYQASKSYLEALEIAESINDKHSIAIIYQNMGEVMALQSQYDKAVGYFNSALNMYGDQNLQKAMAGIYLNLGQIYIELEQWDIAKSYLNKSYVIDTTLKLLNFESIALRQLGITYLKVNKLESAEKLARAALYLQKEKNYFTLVPETHLLLAEVLYQKKEYEEALRLMKEARTIAIEIEDDLLLAKILRLTALILDKKNESKQAMQLMLQSIKLSDSIFNLEKTNSIMNLELAYQTEVKEKQIDELKYTHNLQEQKIKNKSIQIYLLIVSMILIVFFLSSMIVYWRKRQQIELQLREQKFLQGRFEAEEKAKDKIARELHDDIGGQMIGMIMQLQSGGKLNEDEISQLQKVYQEIRRLSHSLDEPIFQELKLQEKLKNYFSELKNQVDFQISFIDDFKIDWEKIEAQQELQRNLYRIIQELITNTVKFAKASDVEIQLINEKRSVVLIYEDNGIGMDLGDRNSKPQFNTIKKRLEMFNGKMETQSEPNKGVFINIQIPFELIKGFK